MGIYKKLTDAIEISKIKKRLEKIEKVLFSKKNTSW